MRDFPMVKLLFPPPILLTELKGIISSLSLRSDPSPLLATSPSLLKLKLELTFLNVDPKFLTLGILPGNFLKLLFRPDVGKYKCSQLVRGFYFTCRCGCVGSFSLGIFN